MACTLHYLTVQDVLWINLQATRKVQHFNYAKLEEATYCQYAYGESNTLLPKPPGSSVVSSGSVPWKVETMRPRLLASSPFYGLTDAASTWTSRPQRCGLRMSSALGRAPGRRSNPFPISIPATITTEVRTSDVASRQL